MQLLQNSTLVQKWMARPRILIFLHSKFAPKKKTVENVHFAGFSIFLCLLRALLVRKSFVEKLFWTKICHKSGRTVLNCLFVMFSKSTNKNMKMTNSISICKHCVIVRIAASQQMRNQLRKSVKQIWHFKSKLYHSQRKLVNSGAFHNSRKRNILENCCFALVYCCSWILNSEFLGRFVPRDLPRRILGKTSIQIAPFSCRLLPNTAATVVRKNHRPGFRQIQRCSFWR